MVSRTLLIALALLAAPLGAQTRTPVDDPVPARDTFSVVSRALGETRLVNLHTPATYRASPAARFAVLYMPDGGLDEDFPHVVHTVDSLVALRVIRPVIVCRDSEYRTSTRPDRPYARRVGQRDREACRRLSRVSAFHPRRAHARRARALPHGD